MSGEVKRWELPGKPGYYVNGTEEWARAHGLIPGAPIDVEPQSEEAVERATLGQEDALVTSATAPVAPRARVAAADPSEGPAEEDDGEGDEARPARAKKRAAPRPSHQ
jgi:hypothetical protein